MPTLNESSGIVTVSSSITIGVPGDWTELIASAARDSVWSLFYVAPADFPSGKRVYLDIAIGPEFSEVIIVNTAYLKNTDDTDFNDSYHPLGLPLRFAAGDRIIAKLRDSKAFIVDYHMMIRNFE